MRVLAPLLLITIVLLVWGWWRSFRLQRLLKGLDKPVLWLPRKERREHARTLLKREQDEYDLERQQDLIDLVRGEVASLTKDKP